MVRAGLKGEVKRIADLRGRIIGVNTSTRNSKTTSQQLVELLLKSDGVSLDAVRIVPAGQSWVEQASLLVTGTADAVMGDEPFASRLLAENKVFFLANLADPGIQKSIPGANFLHAALETRGELIRNEPEKVAKMVRMLRTTLQWMARQTPKPSSANWTSRTRRSARQCWRPCANIAMPTAAMAGCRPASSRKPSGFSAPPMKAMLRRRP